MKNRIIAAIVGGIIVFILQFLAWVVLGIHDKAAKYHPQQQEILNSLSSHITEDGSYLLPRTRPGATMEEEQEMEKNMQRQPMAMVTYIGSYESSMTRSMIRGFLVDIFLVFLLIYIMTRGGNPPLVRWIAGSVSIGLFTWLWGPYMGRIWFQIPWDTISGQLIEAVVVWGICGIWLGWYYNRRRRPA